MAFFYGISALLLQMSRENSHHCLRTAQVSWLGMCGPGISPWSAGTSLLALIEYHTDDKEMLFPPFSLLGGQE